MGNVVPNPVDTTYIPALNRAGWYKYFFLEMLHEPDRLEKMLTAICPDTYKPGVFNQPDVDKRDGTVTASLAGQAAAIRNACVASVSNEMTARMQGGQ